MDEKSDLAMEAYRGGDPENARRLFREHLRDNPQDEEAWLWMARLAETDRERQSFLRQALRINPWNEAASQGLATRVIPEPVASPTPPADFIPVLDRSKPADDLWLDVDRRGWVPFAIAAVLAITIICVLAIGVVFVPQLLEGRLGTPYSATPVAASTDRSATETVTSPEPPTATAEPARSVGVSQPDLVVVRVKIDMDTGAACLQPSSQLGTRVTVANTGDAAAAAFDIEVDGIQQRVVDGLAAGQTTALWFAGYAQGQKTIATVDVGSEVEESDEDNNVFSQRLPVPTPPPICTPMPPVASPEPPGTVSIANAKLLAPVRVSSGSVYSDGPSSFLQLEVDSLGNAHLVVDLPGRLEEWLVIDGVVYAGEGAAEGLSPFEPVADPDSVAGFRDPWEVFAPRNYSDRFASSFPANAVAWFGIELGSAESLGTESVRGLTVEKFGVVVDPEKVPDSVQIADGVTEDLRGAVEMGGENAYVYVWVEPDSAAVVQVEWNVEFPSGRRGQFTLDVRPAEAGPFALPGD